MTKLGIIGAMQVEVEILLGAMNNKTEKNIAKTEILWYHISVCGGRPDVPSQTEGRPSIKCEF